MFFPSLFLCLLIAAFVLLGESMRDAMDVKLLGGMSDPVLAVDDLQVEFRTDEGVVKAVDGVGYALGRGETLAILGESGSGKTVHARAIMRILDSPPAHITGGQARLGDVDAPRRSTRPTCARCAARRSRCCSRTRTRRSTRCSRSATSWSSCSASAGASRKRRGEEPALQLLERVGIPSPEGRMKAYPHQLSGGIAQRVMVAMAVALEPEVLLADEPTSSLDVTVQAQVLDLLASLVADTEMSMVLITHNLAVAVGIANRIAVMYAGRIVELGPGSRRVRGAEAPVHGGPAPLDPRHPDPRGSAAGHQGRAAEPAASADGLRLPPPVSARRRTVPRRRRPAFE